MNVPDWLQMIQTCPDSYNMVQDLNYQVKKSLGKSLCSCASTEPLVTHFAKHGIHTWEDVCQIFGCSSLDQSAYFLHRGEYLPNLTEAQRLCAESRLQFMNQRPTHWIMCDDQGLIYNPLVQNQPGPAQPNPQDLLGPLQPGQGPIHPVMLSLLQQHQNRQAMNVCRWNVVFDELGAYEAIISMERTTLSFRQPTNRFSDAILQFIPESENSLVIEGQFEPFPFQADALAIRLTRVRFTNAPEELLALKPRYVLSRQHFALWLFAQAKQRLVQHFQHHIPTVLIQALKQHLTCAWKASQ